MFSWYNMEEDKEKGKKKHNTDNNAGKSNFQWIFHQRLPRITIQKKQTLIHLNRS